MLSRAQNETGNDGRTIGMFGGGAEVLGGVLQFSWLVCANRHGLLEKSAKGVFFEVESVKSFPDVPL